MFSLLKSYASISLVLLFYCQQLSAQEEAKKEMLKRELSVNADFVAPIFYGMKIQASYLGINNPTIITPDYKFSCVFGVKYKTKEGFLIETQFQPYTFSYQSPIYEIDHGYGGHYPGAPHWVQHYYETFRYTQNRYSLGVGFHRDKKRNIFDVTFGLSYFSGTHSYLDSYIDFNRFDLNGGVYSGGYPTPRDTSILVHVNNIAPYLNISYGYEILKRFYLTASINYCYVSYGGNSWREMALIYDISKIHLLSLNIGVKYNFLK